MSVMTEQPRMKRISVNKKIQKIAKEVARNFQPEKIILFGSWAWGSPGPDSDVDIMIIKRTNNTRKLARQIDSFIFPRPFPMDILVNRPEDIKRRCSQGDFFMNDIMTKGRVLYAA